MLECLIIGDSIAVGTKMFAPTECITYSEKGLNTRHWNRKWGNKPIEARTVVISLGTNDYPGLNTYLELSKIRYRVKSVRVVWVMPPCNAGFCKPKVIEAVKNVALQYGDDVIRTKFVSRDNVHPTVRGYKDLVRQSGI